MPRFLTFLAVALLVPAPARSADDDLARFNQVVIKPATAYVVIATITMTVPTFVREGSRYTSTYSARVFPYFNFNEKGRIWIEVPEAALQRIARGEAIDFTGRAINDAGDGRRVEGHATPNGRSRGEITVRVYVTRRIALNYETTYECVGIAAVTPKPAR